MNLELRSERRDNDVVSLWLGSSGRSVVVLDTCLLDQLHMFFDGLESGPPPAGLVILSESPKAFAAGADLAEISTLNDVQLAAYLTEGADAFARIAALPCPTVAALHGAALGGGLELAMHCDGLIAAKPMADARPYKIGLPEASLGLCPGWGGTQMLPARIDPAVAITMMATGATMSISDPAEGLLDRVIDNEDDLHEAAIHWIESNPDTKQRDVPRCIDEHNRDQVRAGLEAVRPSVPDTPAARAVVEAVEVGLDEGWRAAPAAERRLLVSLRHTATAKAKLDQFLARSS